MTQRIKYCIFDFDGTLADTSDGIVACVKETLRIMGLPEQPSERIRHTIGLPLCETIRQGGSVPDSRVDEGVDIYRSIFFQTASQYILLFPGISETLKDLHSSGIKLAIATSRGQNSLDKILDNYGLNGFFSIKATSSGNWKPKPSPDMVEWILTEFGAKADEALVIGDTSFDIMMGAGAGCRTCGVTWGNHDRKMLESANPEHIIESIEELLDIVL